MVEFDFELDNRLHNGEDIGDVLEAMVRSSSAPLHYDDDKDHVPNACSGIPGKQNTPIPLEDRGDVCCVIL